MDSRWTKRLPLPPSLWLAVCLLAHFLLPGPITCVSPAHTTVSPPPRRNMTLPPSPSTEEPPPTPLTKRVTRRPLYNIAHMVNSLNEVDDFLAKGANGLEADVYFAPNATPVFMFHGYPCDCFRHCGEREKVETYLERIRDLTTPSSKVYNPKLLLLFLDLKLLRIAHSAKALAGQNLATVLLKHLYNGTTGAEGATPTSTDGSTVRTVISIGHVFDYDFVLGFQNELENAGRAGLFRSNIGWDVGMNDPLFVIESMWKRFETVHNIWQGDGRSNCVSPFYNLGRLAASVKKRDAMVVGFGQRNLIRKVYQWTVDLTVNIRTALRTQVDAIITNHPERLLHVIREREFGHRFRLATAKDSPWDRVFVRNSRPPGGPGAAAAAILTKPTLGLKLVNGAGDMLDSLTKYVGDLLRYRTPVKYLYLATYTKQQQKRRRVQYRDGQSDSGEAEADDAKAQEMNGGLVDFTNRNATTTTPPGANQTPSSTSSSSSSLFLQLVQTVLKMLI